MLIASSHHRFRRCCCQRRHRHDAAIATDATITATAAATAAICRYCHRRVIFILSLGPQLVVHGVAVERFSPQQHIRLQEEFSLDTISHLIE